MTSPLSFLALLAIAAAALTAAPADAGRGRKVLVQAPSICAEAGAPATRFRYLDPETGLLLGEPIGPAAFGAGDCLRYPSAVAANLRACCGADRCSPAPVAAAAGAYRCVRVFAPGGELEGEGVDVTVP